MGRSYPSRSGFGKESTKYTVTKTGGGGGAESREAGRIINSEGFRKEDCIGKTGKTGRRGGWSGRRGKVHVRRV